MVKVNLFISIPLAIYTPLSLSRHWSSSCWKHLVAGQIPNRGLKCRELAGLFVRLCLKKSILQIVFLNTLPLDSSGKISSTTGSGWCRHFNAWCRCCWSMQNLTFPSSFWVATMLATYCVGSSSLLISSRLSRGLSSSFNSTLTATGTRKGGITTGDTSSSTSKCSLTASHLAHGRILNTSVYSDRTISAVRPFDIVHFG